MERSRRIVGFLMVLDVAIAAAFPSCIFALKATANQESTSEKNAGKRFHSKRD
jgi:hypothetical protein